MAAVTHDPEMLPVSVERAPVPTAPAQALTALPASAEADRWAGPAHGPVVTVSGGRLGLRVLLGGLAALFLVNSLTALVDPSPFLSLVPGGEDQRWLGLVIAANDLAVAAALIASEWGRGRFRGVRGWQGAIVAWAGVWLLVAAALKGSAL
jgi:hypothetical protein